MCRARSSRAQPHRALADRTACEYTAHDSAHVLASHQRECGRSQEPPAPAKSAHEAAPGAARLLQRARERRERSAMAVRVAGSGAPAPSLFGRALPVRRLVLLCRSVRRRHRLGAAACVQGMLACAERVCVGFVRPRAARLFSQPVACGIATGLSSASTCKTGRGWGTCRFAVRRC